jgi:hypothetical protein
MKAWAFKAVGAHFSRIFILLHGLSPCFRAVQQPIRQCACDRQARGFPGGNLLQVRTSSCQPVFPNTPAILPVHAMQFASSGN